jgi:hypothetical protein
MTENTKNYDINTIGHIKNLLDRWASQERIRRGLPERVGHVSPETLLPRLGVGGVLGYLIKKRLAVFILLAVVVIVTVGAAFAVQTLLSKAAYYQRQLQSLHDIVGLDRAFDVTFETQQPDTFKLLVTVDPALVSKVEVTYDDGQTWRSLYSTVPGQNAYAGTKLQLIEDSKTITEPGIVTARVRAQFVPQVIEAFPQYAQSPKNERVGTFEFTGSAITQLSAEETKTAAQPVSVGLVPLDLPRWEPIISLDAEMQLESQNGAIVQHFHLADVGEYTNIGRSLPAVTAEQPSVSLRQLTRIEIELRLNASEPVTIEPKLVDVLGRVAGVIRVLTPSKDVQTLHIPVGSLKGYWGKNIDFSHVRRFELAVTRKVQGQASTGTLTISRIELFGLGPHLTDSPLTALKKFAELPLESGKWRTASSKNARVSLATEGEMLQCKVELPYDRVKDDELPWTNIETETEQKNLNRPAAIEFWLRWDGPSAITLEPKVVTSPSGDTYGRHIWIQPSSELQKILIYIQDLKYYWSAVGPTEQSRLDLDEVHTFSLGISRKSPAQADSGTLYIKAINFLAVGGSGPD